MTKSAFFLTAGFGTRFQPQTNFLPKPALPFFNLPQALYPAGLLKEIGVSNFYYNSHHLPKELNDSLNPFFNRNSIFEEKILDSAGGIANAKSLLSDEEDFWVVNGDSFVTSLNTEVLSEAYNFHKKTNSIATLVGIKKNNDQINGLGFDTNDKLTHTAKGPNTLHFIGVYIFNKEIFNFIKPQKSHILKDVLLNNFHEKTSVFNARSEITWFETGNELDFIKCHQKEAENILKLQEKSAVYKTANIWGKYPKQALEQFLQNNIWGLQTNESHQSEFLVLPECFTGNINNLNNCVVGRNLPLPPDITFTNKVLIHPSQWT